MKRAASALTLALAAGAVVVPATDAQAADFCSSRISGPTYVQRSYSHGGKVVATLCATGSNKAGTAYLYARGSYANVKKYMKLTITTHTVSGTSTRKVDGDFYQYCYRAQPAGLHDFHAIMYDGHGNKIVDHVSSDYE